MRVLILSATALAFAAPAAAQSVPAPHAADDPLVQALPHPYEVEEMSDKMGRAVGALTKVPVGDVINAVDPAARAHPNTTIADVAGRGDPYFEERMQDQVHSMGLKMADMMRGVAVVMPQLRRSLEQIEHSIADAVHGVPRR